MKTNKVIQTVLLSSLVLTMVGGSTLAATASDLTGKGTVNFEKSTEVTTPKDPEKPGEEVEPKDDEDLEVNPGPAGDLSLDLVSNFNFGTLANYKVSGAEQIKAAAPVTLTDNSKRGNWVQITDQRAGNPAGWKLTAKMDGEFTNGTNATLTGAYMTLANQNVMSNIAATTPEARAGIVKLQNGVEAEVMNATAGKGNGTTTVEFGMSTDDTMSKSVNLHILPGTGVETTSAYTTDVVWTLADLD